MDTLGVILNQRGAPGIEGYRPGETTRLLGLPCR